MKFRCDPKLEHLCSRSDDKHKAKTKLKWTWGSYRRKHREFAIKNGLTEISHRNPGRFRGRFIRGCTDPEEQDER